jgi:quercetin dioxygenase-like cupin family protein
MRGFLIAGLLVVGPASAAAQQPSADSAGMTLYPSGEVQWKDGPASLPKGARMAILEGDPTQPGVFTMRIKFPAGFKVSPHYHSQTEHATVISGALSLGMGRVFEKSAMRVLPAGSFGYWPAGTPHFAWFEHETVLQLHGQGPWTVTYVNPADDPRKPAP